MVVIISSAVVGIRRVIFLVSNTVILSVKGSLDMDANLEFYRWL